MKTPGRKLSTFLSPAQQPRDQAQCQNAAWRYSAAEPIWLIVHSALTEREWRFILCCSPARSPYDHLKFCSLPSRSKPTPRFSLTCHDLLQAPTQTWPTASFVRNTFLIFKMYSTEAHAQTHHLPLPKVGFQEINIKYAFTKIKFSISRPSENLSTSEASWVLRLFKNSYHHVILLSFVTSLSIKSLLEADMAPLRATHNFNSLQDMNFLLKQV